jgi:hypothetical protein
VSQASHPQPARSAPDQLIKLGVERARGGDRQAARNLFLALTREFPDDTRVWIGLAGVAASRNEQREALERIVSLDPGNQRALSALRRFAPTEVAPAERVTQVLPETRLREPQPLAATDPNTTPVAAADDEPQQASFPLLNLIALALMLLLLVAVGVILGRALLGGERALTSITVTPALILQPGAGEPGPAATAASTAAPLPSAAAQPDSTVAPTGAANATAGTLSPQPAQSTPAAAASAAPPTPTLTEQQPLTLPLGTPIDYDGWTAVLVRPDYALPLDGAIGDLQPAGRFVLTVVAVSNNSPSPRVIPPDLFALVDSAGRSFAPVPGASSAYLNIYERAQRGDLALEDSFDPVVGLRSVPLIFDVPLDATGLRLVVNGAGPAGWPVGETLPASAPAGP